MKSGDRVIITKIICPNKEPFFFVGDKATLTHQDGVGDWWADFDERSWHDGNREFCIQKGFSECRLIEENKKLDCQGLKKALNDLIEASEPFTRNGIVVETSRTIPLMTGLEMALEAARKSLMTIDGVSDESN